MITKIKVMVVDDSLVFREFLKKSLSEDPSFEIVGTFADPVEAMNQIWKLRPDVITVDMEMPNIRGDEFMRRVLPRNPNVKAVVISSLSSNVFDAMHAGAIEFVGKPGSQPGYTREQFVIDIKRTVKIAASANMKARSNTAGRQTAPASGIKRGMNLLSASSKSLIAIGASTGGTEAIIQVVKDFPKNTPGVVIVQHMPPVFTRMYAERVDRSCAMNVREAANGDRVDRGVMLIAPGGDQQMRIHRDAKGYYVTLSTEPKVNGHCPSVDVLFESVSKIAGSSAVGIILTGMGADGAKGLLQMRNAGAHTIGQDEATCIVYGMPQVAYDIGGVVEQLALPSIGAAALRRFSV